MFLENEGLLDENLEKYSKCKELLEITDRIIVRYENLLKWMPVILVFALITLITGTPGGIANGLMLLPFAWYWGVLRFKPKNLRVPDLNGHHYALLSIIPTNVKSIAKKSGIYIIYIFAAFTLYYGIEHYQWFGISQIIGSTVVLAGVIGIWYKLKYGKNIKTLKASEEMLTNQLNDIMLEYKSLKGA